MRLGIDESDFEESDDANGVYRALGAVIEISLISLAGGGKSAVTKNNFDLIDGLFEQAEAVGAAFTCRAGERATGSDTHELWYSGRYPCFRTAASSSSMATFGSTLTVFFVLSIGKIRFNLLVSMMEPGLKAIGRVLPVVP